MAISTTANFESTFSIDEVIEEAYERCGVQSITGHQLKSARRTLNILFQEWGNRGIHFWEVGNTNINLVFYHPLPIFVVFVFLFMLFVIWVVKFCLGTMCLSFLFLCNSHIYSFKLSLAS